MASLKARWETKSESWVQVKHEDPGEGLELLLTWVGPTHHSPLRSPWAEPQTVAGAIWPYLCEHHQPLPILYQLAHWFHHSHLQRGKNGGEFTKTINLLCGRLQAHKLLPAPQLPRIQHSLPRHQSNAFIHSQHNKKRKKERKKSYGTPHHLGANLGCKIHFNESIWFGTIKAITGDTQLQLQIAIHQHSSPTWSFTHCVTWGKSLSLPVLVFPLWNDGFGSPIRASSFHTSTSRLSTTQGLLKTWLGNSGL